MKDFSLSTLFAIARDMTGIAPWILFGLAGVVILGSAYALIRHGLKGPQFRVAAICGAIGGLVTIEAAPMLTTARFENLNGTLDWLSIVLIGISSGVAIAVLLFAILGLAKPAGSRP